MDVINCKKVVTGTGTFAMAGMAAATPAAIAAGIAAGSWATMHVNTRNLQMQCCCLITSKKYGCFTGSLQA
jgi:hypothetical protein